MDWLRPKDRIVLLSNRLGSDTQKNDEFIDSMLEAVREEPGCIDEVWFATDYGFPPLSVHERSAQRLSEVAEKIRSAGLRISLQLSNSIGHGEYMASRNNSGLVYEGSPVEHLVGPDGTEAKYCFCWRGKNLLSYVKQELALYTSLIRPDVVWADDDLRPNNHAPVNLGCFCPDCISRFNTLYSASFSREELVNEINRGDKKWRNRWIDFVREGLHDFTYEISKTVAENSPGTAMGYQYCANGGYTGNGYDFIFRPMFEATGIPPVSRPGGGAYDGQRPDDFADKANLLDWQNAMLPDYVNEIRPEIENLPDVQFGKSVPSCLFETSLYFAHGATAMSYAMMMNDYEPMSWHKKMFSGFAKVKPYWLELSKYNSFSVQTGLVNAVSTEGWQRALCSDDQDFSWTREAYSAVSPLSRCAIPIATVEPAKSVKTPVYILHSANASAMSDREIEKLLSYPVICDGESLYILGQRGFKFSAASVPCETRQLYERFSSHPINAGIEGRTWSQAFHFPKGHYLVDTDGTTEPIGFYETKALNLPPFLEGEHGYGLSSAVVKTSKGAKWAVFGQYLWNRIISSDRRRQIISTAEYIGGKMKAVLETPWQGQLLPREDADGNIVSVSFVNMTIGASDPLKIRIRQPKSEKFVLMTQSDPIRRPVSTVSDGDGVLTEIPPVDPWTVATIFAV